MKNRNVSDLTEFKCQLKIDLFKASYWQVACILFLYSIMVGKVDTPPSHPGSIPMLGVWGHGICAYKHIHIQTDCMMCEWENKCVICLLWLAFYWQGNIKIKKTFHFIYFSFVLLCSYS